MAPLMTWELFAEALVSPSYQAAQQRALRQLIEALLFEEVLTAEMTVQEPDLMRFEIPGLTLDGRQVTYSCVGRVSASFGRIRLNAATLIRCDAEGKRPATSLQEFLCETGLLTGTDEPLMFRFLRELQHTVLNDTLGRHTRHQGGLERDLTALEGQLQDGHPYHPCYKSRIGFDPIDNASYGPELAPAVRLSWLALRRTLAIASACHDIDVPVFLKHEIGEALHAHLCAKLKSKGLSLDDYLLLPSHPWQWREKLAADLFPLMQCDDLVWIGEGTDEYRPLQSIRSLANVTRPLAASVKLPISIVNTSADRILSCHNVENAPPVSDWLSNILQQDAVLRSTGLVFLREVVGITYRDPSLPPFLQAQQYGILGAVWRENVDTVLRIGESAAPFSGLCQCEGDGRPFIAPWVAQYGLIAWLDALLDASVTPLIHLLYAHGIGMESHAQNIVLIHRAGWPSRIALKDLPGGLRFVRRYLADPDACPSLVPTPSFRKQVNATAGMETAAPSDVRDYFHDAVFFINFGELSLFLHEHYGLAEEVFWASVANCIAAYQGRHPELTERFAAFDLFAPTIKVEQLAKRRLFAETEARLQQVANPLYRYRPLVGRQAACEESA